MPEVSVRVKSPLKSAAYTISIDNEDVFASVRQYLLALSPLLQPATAFELALNGERVAGETAISAVVDADDKEIDLSMDLVEQTWKDVETQLERLQDQLGLMAPESTYLNAAPTRLAEIKAGSKKTKKMSEDQILELVEATTPNDDLSVLAAYPNAALPKPAARELQTSKWQAAARDPRLRLQGVLGFIRFVASDGKTWHVVASTRGFTAVPQLTDHVFALPAKTAVYVPTLTQLIEQVSPMTIGLARKFADKLKANPLSCVAVPQVLSVAPWLVDDVPSVGSGYCGLTPTRSDDSVVPERNEDFQSAREIQADTIAERISRDRRLCQTTFEFAAAATETATRIVEGAIKPLNPDEEPEGAHVYLSNGIFFTHGADFTEAYTAFGGDVGARQAAKKDLRGVEQLLLLDEPQLCPVLTSVVDYMGRRIVAQAPVPGIFRETEEPMIVYGRSENKETVYNDEKVGTLMEKLAQRLHLKPHPVTRDGVELHTSADVHGTRGTDGRIYAIDLARLQIPDLLSSTEGLNLLRPEAISSYFLSKRNDEVPPEPLNPDVWMPKDDFPQSYAEEFDKDIAAAKRVATYVREDLAPTLIQNIADGSGVDPIDGQHLTTILHRAGVNMRLLGLIWRLAKKADLGSAAAVALEEAIARTLKHLLNAKLKVTPMVQAASAVQEFVQSFRQQDAATVSAVKRHLEMHFGFSDLPPRWAEEHLGRLSLLRLLSYKIGLQWDTNLKLAAINPVVRFAAPRSLLAEEALEAGRRSLEAASHAKQDSVSSADESSSQQNSGEETIDKAGGSDETSERPKSSEAKTAEKAEDIASTTDADVALSEGFTLVTEAVSIYSQVYGAAHAETARVMNHAALMFLEYDSDLRKAIEFERRAVTIAERVEGLDSHEVLVMYSNLAYFERTAGHLATALELSQRVLDLSEKLAWPGYTGYYMSLSSIASMLYQSGKVKLQKASLVWFEKALQAATQTPGGARGTLWFDYAQSQLLNQDLKGAVRSMEQSHAVFKSTAGPDDDNTKETKKYLEQLLQLTVQSAQSQAAASAALSHQQQEQRAATAAAKSRKGKKGKSNVPRLGERNLNEVLDYIMGDSQKSKKN